MRLLALLVNLSLILPCYAETVPQVLIDSTLHIEVGTGFLYQSASGKQYIVTAWHVCTAAVYKNRLYASYVDGKQVVGEANFQSPASDLCAAFVPGPNKQSALKLASGVSPKDRVYTRGYPHHILTDSAGYIRGTLTWDHDFEMDDMSQCPTKRFNPITSLCTITFNDSLSNVYSRPGSSGSPVVNAQGDLVGVVTSWLQSSDKWNSELYEAGLVNFKVLSTFLRKLP